MARFIQDGDVFELVDGDRVYAMVPKHLVYANRKGDWSLTRNDVMIEGVMSYLAGTYICTKTALDSGGCGHGPHDVYPNGHHVYAVKVDDRDCKVDFYQSGSFTAMIGNRKPIGKATLEWKWDAPAALEDTNG